MNTRQAENKVTYLFSIINKINYKNIMKHDTIINKIKEMSTNELETIKNTLEKTKFQTSKKITKLNKKIYDKRHRIKNNKISKSSAQDQIQINTNLSTENTNAIELNKLELFLNDELLKQYEEYNTIIDYVIDMIEIEQNEEQGPRVKRPRLQEQVLLKYMQVQKIRYKLIRLNNNMVLPQNLLGRLHQ